MEQDGTGVDGKHGSEAGAEQIWRDAFEAMACGVAVLNPLGEVLYRNRAGARVMAPLLGLSPEQVTGSPEAMPRLTRLGAGMAILNEDGKELDNSELPYLQALRTRSEQRGGTMGLRADDGTVRWLQVDWVPVLANDGSLEQLILSFVDITEHKRAQDYIRSLNEDLEKRVQDRTAELEQAYHELQEREQALEAAKAEAEAANRAKNEFLSRTSHELRTPLNSILGFAELMDMDERNPEDREAIGIILKAGRHLLDLINEVLDIARIEAGQLPLSREPVDVTEILSDAVALMQPMAAERSVQLECLPAGCDCHVMADQQRFKQIVLNLLSNAIKYNRPDGKVMVSCHALSDSLRIVVADTGVGIAPEYLGRLFNPFDRLGAEQTAVEGTGLGLALSKRLVEAMNGRIDVDSILGRGTAFTVELPRAPGLETQLEAAEMAAATVSPEPPAGAHRVLYIEDNLSNFRLIERVLARRPGTALLSAMQGGLGLELAREHRPDLILLDMHLPDMEGIEVLQRLQADPRTRQIPVIVVSADATAHRIERAEAAGAHAYLTKPLQVGRFLEALDEILAVDATGEKRTDG